MIQRIQTLFLLAASGLQFSMLFSRMAFSVNESVKYTDIITLLIMIVVTFLISFFTIFLYRHRMVQIRMCTLNSLILLGLQGFIIWMFVVRPEGSVFTISAVFPVVSAILVFTALRYIARDEAMVRSTSRLRK